MKVCCGHNRLINLCKSYCMIKIYALPKKCTEEFYLGGWVVLLSACMHLGDDKISHSFQAADHSYKVIQLKVRQKSGCARLLGIADPQ